MVQRPRTQDAVTSEKPAGWAIAKSDQGGRWLFDRQIVPGGGNKSQGDSQAEGDLEVASKHLPQLPGQAEGDLRGFFCGGTAICFQVVYRKGPLFFIIKIPIVSNIFPILLKPPRVPGLKRG
jgi:hypothetical protein